MKKSDIDGIKKQATAEAIDVAMTLLFGIPVKVLHDKYGWGMKKRLPEFAEAIIEVYQEFVDGELTLEELSELVYEQCGIRFEKGDANE